MPDAPTLIRCQLAPEWLSAAQPGDRYDYAGISTIWQRSYTDDDGQGWVEALALLTEEEQQRLGDENWPWQAAPAAG